MAQKWYQKASVQTAIVSGLFLLIGIAIPYFLKIPKLKDEIKALSKENAEKTAVIQRLETQLTPFKTIALEKYTGSEQEALQKLAKRFQELEQQVAIVEKHQKNEQEKIKQINILKNTAPEVDAHLRCIAEGEKYVVYITSNNLVPFLARWFVVNKNDSIISGFSMNNTEFHPTQHRKAWKYKININKKEITDDFAELRFRFRSAYYAEMGNPDYLKGEILRKYLVSQSKPFLKEIK